MLTTNDLKSPSLGAHSRSKTEVSATDRNLTPIQDQLERKENTRAGSSHRESATSPLELDPAARAVFAAARQNAAEVQAELIKLRQERAKIVERGAAASAAIMQECAKDADTELAAMEESGKQKHAEQRAKQAEKRQQHAEGMSELRLESQLNQAHRDAKLEKIRRGHAAETGTWSDPGKESEPLHVAPSRSSISARMESSASLASPPVQTDRPGAKATQGRRSGMSFLWNLLLSGLSWLRRLFGF